MSINKNKPGKKMSREALITIIGLLLLSVISAAFVINFRIKMKKFQITPKEAEQMLKEEKEFNKAQTSPHKKPLEE